MRCGTGIAARSQRVATEAWAMAVKTFTCVLVEGDRILLRIGPLNCEEEESSVDLLKLELEAGRDDGGRLRKSLIDLTAPADKRSDVHRVFDNRPETLISATEELGKKLRQVAPHKWTRSRVRRSKADLLDSLRPRWKLLSGLDTAGSDDASLNELMEKMVRYEGGLATLELLCKEQTNRRWGRRRAYTRKGGLKRGSVANRRWQDSTPRGWWWRFLKQSVLTQREEALQKSKQCGSLRLVAAGFPSALEPFLSDDSQIAAPESTEGDRLRSSSIDDEEAFRGFPKSECTQSVDWEEVAPLLLHHSGESMTPEASVSIAVAAADEASSPWCPEEFSESRLSEEDVLAWLDSEHVEATLSSQANVSRFSKRLARLRVVDQIMRDILPPKE